MRATPQLAAALLAAVVTERCRAWRAIDDVALEMSLLQAETERAGSFFMVELADPQFGMMHFQKLNWTEEQEMLDLAVAHINRLKPAFVVLVGDMQNWWQTDLDGENGLLVKLDKSVQVKAILAGNHDVGDAPTSASLAFYEKTWGQQYGYFDWEGVRFVFINSQLYYADAAPASATRNQTDFLRKQLESAGYSNNIHGVVILSHIPPFVGSTHETHGWANWLESHRSEVLTITQHARLPANLFVCGHFHGNVQRVYSEGFEARVEVVTSSSVGSPMYWNGDEGPYSPDLASNIAAMPNGSAAFLNYIAKDNGWSTDGEPNFKLKEERILARADRSGVRLFEFDPSQGYRHRWLTLQELSEIESLDKALSGHPFTRFHKRTA